jgi:hypothetical protein
MPSVDAFGRPRPMAGRRQPASRTDLRPEVVAPTNKIADDILSSLPPELLGVDRELLYRGMLTAAHRLRENGHGRERA